jgi:malate dehydrogenase (oxaloacetate-decarboxylating)
MFMTAARALTALSPVDKDRTASLLPPLAESRRLSRVIAAAVARQAIQDGLSNLKESEVDAAVDANVWEPRYVRYERDY